MTTQTTTNNPLKINAAGRMMLPASAKDRATTEFTKLANEIVTVTVGPQDGGVFTWNVFSSELGVLRLYHAFLGKGRVFFSKNLATWVYQHRMEGFYEIEGEN